MTVERDNRELARRWNEEVFEKRNLDAIGDLVAEEFVGYDPGLPAPIRGPDGVREAIEMVLSAFPDMQVKLEAVVAEGDRIAVRNSITGTHDGEYMGIEPTGEEVETMVVAFQRIEDGRLIEERQLVDRLAMLQQLGAVEPPNPTRRGRR